MLFSSHGRSRRAYDGPHTAATEPRCFPSALGLVEYLCAKILVLVEVDDISEQVESCLKVSGYEVIAPADYSAAIRLLQDQHVDLIISAVHLEYGGTVFDFLKWVRNHDATRATPFVLLSCQPTELAKYIEEGLKMTSRILGATKYLSMDLFDPFELKRQVKSLISNGSESAKLTLR